LVPLYQGACALAIPSREEGLGLVAVEAQLCGTPVVAYADGGLIDVVRPDHGGTLVTVGDSRALGEALARVLTDETAAHQRGIAAREDMLSRFSPEAVAGRYLTHYRQAVR
jgi:glycosyltransferase involved in cell wall biosynthesis